MSFKNFIDNRSSFSEEDKLPSREQMLSFYDEYRQTVGKVLADSIPDIEFGQPDSTEAAALSLDQLVTLRRAHESTLEQKAVRTSNSVKAEQDDTKARFELIKKVDEAMKLQQVQGPGTGCDRRTRWKTEAKKQTGNAANAAVAALKRAHEVSF